MSTLQQLETYYSHVTRIRPGLIGGVDLATLMQLAQQVDAGTTTFDAAATQVEGLAAGSVSVAELTYQFFTGATPYIGGLDFLAQPDGQNPNNLNSAYFQGFSVSNRYINLAVSLGSAGEGEAAFTAAYGAGTLADATTRAYAAIFGFAPAAGKVDAILNAPAPDGRGGTYTRADYLAELGQSPRDGLGAKAAMVGFLLGEAVKADLGPYAHALDAFLSDLGPDGIAKGHVDLLDTYGPAPAALPGATITVDHAQSVSPTAADPSLRSTAGDDRVTGANGLDIGQSVVTGAGADTVTIHGVTLGALDTGDGRDVITLDSLGGTTTTVATLGHPAMTGAGSVSAGAGDDQISITAPLPDFEGAVGTGSVIDGGPGDDTLTLLGPVQLSYPIEGVPLAFSGIEHLVMLGYSEDPATAQQGGFPREAQAAVFNLAQVTGVLDVTDASTGDGPIVVRSLEPNTSIISRDTEAGLRASFRTDVPIADLYLDHDHDGLNDQTPDDANGIQIAAVTDTLRVHVVSDSALAQLTTYSSAMTIDGTGRLVTPVNHVSLEFAPFTLDASASAGVSLQFVANDVADGFTLSAAADTLVLELPTPNVTTVTLGAGADTLTVRALANLNIANNTTVTGYATVTDFQKGVDHLVLPSDAMALPKVVAAGATTLEAALIAVSPQVAAGAYALFEYGGDSWIYHQDATVGANTGDGLIRLPGVTDLAVVTGAATGDIHYG